MLITSYVEVSFHDFAVVLLVVGCLVSFVGRPTFNLCFIALTHAYYVTSCFYESRLSTRLRIQQKSFLWKCCKKLFVFNTILLLHNNRQGNITLLILQNQDMVDTNHVCMQFYSLKAHKEYKT